MDQRKKTGRGKKIPAEAKDVSFLKTVQTGSGAHPASHSTVSGVISRE
jgi:hypothetical protein